MKKKQTQLEKDIEFIKLELQKINNQNTFSQLPRLKITSNGTNGTNGEWCAMCGAWRWYGQPDNHHCTGYKITC